MKRPATRVLCTVAAALVAAAIAVGCARIVMPHPTAGDATRAGTTLEALEKGRSLYVARCSGCHQPVPPGDVAPTAWPSEVREMSERAHLDGREEDLIIEYLVTLSSRSAAAHH